MTDKESLLSANDKKVSFNNVSFFYRTTKKGVRVFSGEGDFVALFSNSDVAMKTCEFLSTLPEYAIWFDLSALVGHGSLND